MDEKVNTCTIGILIIMDRKLKAIKVIRASTIKMLEKINKELDFLKDKGPTKGGAERTKKIRKEIMELKRRQIMIEYFEEEDNE